jgi:uncharacterized protein
MTLTGRPAACCPDLARAGELAHRLGPETWLQDAVRALAASSLPDAWIGAGAIRDVIWGQLGPGFDAAAVRDIDVAFFDPADLSPDRDEQATAQLRSLLDRPWEAANQAAVHTWYHHYFGGPPVPAFRRVHDAIATWPETATCVGVRATDDALTVCAPYGLDDLLDGIWRRNPTRVTLATSQARLARHRVAHRWPAVTVIPPLG